MNHKVRLGLIGVGQWGMNYVKTIENTESVLLKSIACKNFEGKSELQKKYRLTNNWHDIINSSDIDGIIISTPPNLHFEIACEAIKNGKPIIVEKPLTLNFTDAKYILALAQKEEVSVKVNHIYLYHPMYKFLKKNIKSKNKIISILSEGGNFGPFRDSVSPLWDWGPHDLSMCMDFLDEFPISIDAEYLKVEEQNKKANIKIKLFFGSKKKAEIVIGNVMKTKTRKFKVNFKSVSYLFDPINFINIQEEKNNKLKSFDAHNKDKNDFEKPLNILINNFIKEIKENKFDIEDLKLAVKVINIIEKIDNVLKIKSKF